MQHYGLQSHTNKQRNSEFGCDFKNSSQGMNSGRQFNNHSMVLDRQNGSRNIDERKSFADLRLKMGEKNKDDDINSIPSDISGDEWAEIQRYE